MKTVLIKQSRPDVGRDTKIFRAYTIPDPETQLNIFGRHQIESLGISASTTSNVEFGVLRCAAKAFAQHAEPAPRLAEDWEKLLVAKRGIGEKATWLVSPKS